MVEHEARDKQLDGDYRFLFSTIEGKRVLADLAMMTGVDALGFCAEDTHRSAFCAGARSIGLYIRKRMDEKADEDRQEVADGVD